MGFPDVFLRLDAELENLQDPYATLVKKLKLAGNSLVFVNKYSGKISTYSTSLDLDTLLVKYEEENLIWRLVIKDIDSLSQKQLLFLKKKLKLRFNTNLQNN